MCPFSQLIGNNEVKKQLTFAFERDSVGNSLLFCGPEGIGKGLFAYEFAKMLICRYDPEGLHRKKVDACLHPDLRILRPEGKTGMHGIETMRALSQEVYDPPYEARCKVFIIHEADRMLLYSANALLKTFEEPAQTSVLILVSSFPNAILQTICSRCVKIHFNSVPIDQISSLLQARYGVEKISAEKIAVHSGGCVGRAIQLAQQGSDMDVKESILLSYLAKGLGQPYAAISEVSQQLNVILEKGKKEVEEEIRKILEDAAGEGLSAVQKQAMEKEIEGAVSTYFFREVETFLGVLLGWFRDVELHSVGGGDTYLIHPAYAGDSLQAFQRGELRSLEGIQAAVMRAKMAVQRSTTFLTVFESLLLSLAVKN